MVVTVKRIQESKANEILSLLQIKTLLSKFD